MAEFYRFFNSTLDDPRKYDADEFAEYFRQILTDGIFNGGTNLQVTCDNSNMKVKVNEGFGWIKGYLYKVDSEGVELQLDNADVSNDRIDRIVLRWDKENRYIRAFVLKGTPAVSPVLPNLIRNDRIFEISLAQVRVIAGKSYINSSEITDERLDENVCGLVNSLVQVDTTTMQQEFDSFMATLEGQTYALDSHVGDITTLNTSDKTNAVGAINELKSQADNSDAQMADLKSDLTSTALNKGASTIGIHDASGNFTAINVEGALEELFQSVTSGKDDIYSALVTKGITPGSKAFADLYNAILTSDFVRTNDANAIAGQILVGKTAYVNGGKVTGTIANKGESTIGGNLPGATLPQLYNATSNADVGRFDLNLDDGFYTGLQVHIPNLIPANIRKGIVIGDPNGSGIGITGTLEEGDYKIGDMILQGHYVVHSKGQEYYTSNNHEVLGLTSSPGAVPVSFATNNYLILFDDSEDNLIAYRFNKDTGVYIDKVVNTVSGSIAALVAYAHDYDRDKLYILGLTGTIYVCDSNGVLEQEFNTGLAVTDQIDYYHGYDKLSVVSRDGLGTLKLYDRNFNEIDSISGSDVPEPFGNLYSGCYDPINDLWILADQEQSYTNATCYITALERSNGNNVLWNKSIYVSYYGQVFVSFVVGLEEAIIAVKYYDHQADYRYLEVFRYNPVSGVSIASIHKTNTLGYGPSPSRLIDAVVIGKYGVIIKNTSSEGTYPHKLIVWANVPKFGISGLLTVNEEASACWGKDHISVYGFYVYWNSITYHYLSPSKENLYEYVEITG